MSVDLEYTKFNQPITFQVLSDAQWEAIYILLPNHPKRSRGKPHSSWRYVLNSILYVLHRGGNWNALDKTPEYVSKSSTHRWFLLWEKPGLLTEILGALKECSDDSISFPTRRQQACSNTHIAEPVLKEVVSDYLQRIIA